MNTKSLSPRRHKDFILKPFSWKAYISNTKNSSYGVHKLITQNALLLEGANISYQKPFSWKAISLISHYELKEHYHRETQLSV